VVVAANCLFVAAWVGCLIFAFANSERLESSEHGSQLWGTLLLAMLLAVPVSVAANTYALTWPRRIPAMVLAFLWLLAVGLLIAAMSMTWLFAAIAMPPMVWTPMMLLQRWNPTNSP
jgi:hypothetical protein